MSQELQLPELIRLWDSLLADDRRFEFLGYFCCAMLLYAALMLLSTSRHARLTNRSRAVGVVVAQLGAAGAPGRRVCGQPAAPPGASSSFAVACVRSRSSRASSTPTGSWRAVQNYPIAEIHDVLQLAYQLRQEDRATMA